MLLASVHLLVALLGLGSRPSIKSRASHCTMLRPLVGAVGDCICSASSREGLRLAELFLSFVNAPVGQVPSVDPSRPRILCVFRLEVSLLMCLFCRWERYISDFCWRVFRCIWFCASVAFMLPVGHTSVCRPYWSDDLSRVSFRCISFHFLEFACSDFSFHQR